MDDQAVEQRHLAMDVLDVGGDRQAREIIPQRVAARIEIEGHGIVALEAEEIDQQPGNEGLADLWPRRCDDENRGPPSAYRGGPKHARPKHARPKHARCKHAAWRKRAIRLMRARAPVHGAVDGRRRFLAVAPRHVALAS
jgi:hypothetical protein